MKYMTEMSQQTLCGKREQKSYETVQEGNNKTKKAE